MTLLALAALLLSPAHAAFSKDKLLTHVRESFAIPSTVPLQLSEPRPSGLPGLKTATLKIGTGEQTQTRDLFISEDEKHYFLAEKQDMTVSPDAERRKKLRLEGAPAKGPKSAPITIVEFSDFQCPFCRQAHQGLQKGLAEYGDKVRLVFKNFPLERIHPWAMPAAVAAACAGRQSEAGFWALADGFFEKQAEISPETLKAKALELASRAKLDTKKLQDCMDKSETADAVRKDIEEGLQLGVGSTPSFLVNGHPVSGFREFAPFKELIQEMLDGKHAK